MPSPATFSTANGTTAVHFPATNSHAVGSGIAAMMLTCIADCADCDCLPSPYPTEEAYSSNPGAAGGDDDANDEVQARVEAVRRGIIRRDGDESKYNSAAKNTTTTTTEGLGHKEELKLSSTSNNREQQASSAEQVCEIWWWCRVYRWPGGPDGLWWAYVPYCLTSIGSILILHL